MNLRLTLEQEGRQRSLNFSYSRIVNAGYAGRDQDEVRRHIEELAAKGIPGPETTPTLYPIPVGSLVTDSCIEVYGRETSGEVEYVLLVEDRDTIYVGLGSDHTDRFLEKIDIARSKQICPNVICQTVWPLAEVKNHWDDLILRSKAVKDGEVVLYQEGPLGRLLDPAALTEFVRSKIAPPLDATVIFSGTLSTVDGGFIYGDRFLAELIDPKLGRRLELSYDIRPLGSVQK